MSRPDQFISGEQRTDTVSEMCFSRAMSCTCMAATGGKARSRVGLASQRRMLLRHAIAKVKQPMATGSACLLVDALFGGAGLLPACGTDDG